jgi:thiol-disulfide isomerase/thioredoxin
MKTSSTTLQRLALAALALTSAAGAWAQGVPSDSVLRGFQRNWDLLLFVNGKEIPAAEVYLAERVPAYLVLTSAFPSPVLLSPRTGNVETVHIMKVAKQPDGSIDLLADAVPAPSGQFKLDGENVLFTVAGKKASLNPKPPLLGQKKNGDLKTHSPGYVKTAKGYTPNPSAMAALKKETKPVVVRVFFGSWCPHCKSHIPYILRVEDELKSNKIRFEYVGLPRDMDSPEAKQQNIREVPQAIVLYSGREIGRIKGTGDWEAPEVKLSRVLATPQPAKGK